MERAFGLAIAIALAACTSVSAVRVAPSAALARRHLRPIAKLEARVTCAYLFFIPIPGHVSRDYVNHLLRSAANRLGADNVVDVAVDITPDDGIGGALRKLLGWRTAEATGVAVVGEDEANIP